MVIRNTHKVINTEHIGTNDSIVSNINIVLDTSDIDNSENIDPGQIYSPKNVSEIKMVNDSEDVAIEKYSKLQPKPYLPSMPFDKDTVLAYNPSVYSLFKEIDVEWPCLSFDFLDRLPCVSNENSGFSISLIAGTQAHKSSKNKLFLLKLGNLREIRKELPISGTLTDDEEFSEDENEEEEMEISFMEISHQGCVNRIKSLVLPEISFAASWSDSGKVFLWDLNTKICELDRFKNDKKTKQSSQTNIKPSFTISSHKNEGYALAWKGTKLLSGDCSGNIFLTEATQSGWKINSDSFVGHLDGSSIEDLAWSTGEANIFSSGGTDGCIKIWDIRCRSSIAGFKASDSDVNTLSWNEQLSHLFITGHDDGSFSTWDLRNLNGNSVATFNWHSGPITSIEWSKHDASLIAVSGSDDQLTIWDLSLEKDDQEEETNVPSQLLFVHQGQIDMKESHWHPIHKGVIMSTAASGFHVFKTFNV